jgi:hypothetical protein
MNCLMIAKLQEFTRYSSRSAYLHLPQEESANGQTQKTKQKKKNHANCTSEILYGGKWSNSKVDIKQIKDTCKTSDIC